MLVMIGVIAYIQMVALVGGGGYVIFSLFTPQIVPASMTLEQALHVTMQ